MKQTHHCLQSNTDLPSSSTSDLTLFLFSFYIWRTYAFLITLITKYAHMFVSRIVSGLSSRPITYAALGSDSVLWLSYRFVSFVSFERGGDEDQAMKS